MASPELAGGPHVGIRQDRHRPEVRSLPRQSARNVGFGEPRLGHRHSGAQGAGADAPNTIRPGVFFGKGFGDLPDSLSWLRPFAATGAVVEEVPIGSGAKALAPNLTTGVFDTVLSPAVETVHWGFSVQYSTLYLTNRFDGGPPKEDPLDQWVPLVEFKFDSARGHFTAASANPGFAYVAVTWQVAAEMIISAQSRRWKRSGIPGAATVLPR